MDLLLLKRTFFSIHIIAICLSINASLKLFRQDCSNFLAGNAIRAQARNTKLETRAVFGSVCRHEYPLRFLNMKHGERLGL